VQARSPWPGRPFITACLILSGLAACNRDAAPMTACLGDKPAVERVEDVAPPNCPK